MGIANDLKANASNLDGELRSTAAELKDRAKDVTDHVRDTVRDEVRDGVRSVHEGMTKTETELRQAGRSLKDRALDGLERTRAGIEEIQDEVVEVSRKVTWKTALGLVVGVALVAGVVMIARRRGLRERVIHKGLENGMKYAMLVPAGLLKLKDAQKEIRHDAQRTAEKGADQIVQFAKVTGRTSEKLWRKLPRIHIETR